MVELVCIVAQAVHACHGIGDAPYNHKYIPAVVVGALEQRVPIQSWRAAPYIHKQDGGQLLVGVRNGLDDPLGWLHMDALDGVFVIGLLLVHIRAVAYLYRCSASQDFRRDGWQH